MTGEENGDGTSGWRTRCIVGERESGGALRVKVGQARISGAVSSNSCPIPKRSGHLGTSGAPRHIDATDRPGAPHRPPPPT